MESTSIAVQVLSIQRVGKYGERCGLIALQAKEFEVQSEGKPERDSTACYQSDGPTETDRNVTS